MTSASSSIYIKVSFATITVVAVEADDGAVIFKPRVADCSDYCTVDNFERLSAYRMCYGKMATIPKIRHRFSVH